MAWAGGVYKDEVDLVGLAGYHIVSVLLHFVVLLPMTLHLSITLLFSSAGRM